VVAHQSANMENGGGGAWIVRVQRYANTAKIDKIVWIVAAICIANTINTNHDVKFVAGLNYVKRHYVKRAASKNTMDIVCRAAFIYVQKLKYPEISKQKRMPWCRMFLKHIRILVGSQTKRSKMDAPNDARIYCWNSAAM
jgi:hypothetical protein